MKRIDKVLKNIQAEFDGRFCCDWSRTGVYGDLIQLIGAEQFTWNGFKENGINTLTSHYAERAINSGLALAYEIPKDVSTVNSGFAITPCAFASLRNNNGISNKVITKGSDYSLEFDLTTDKCVLIKNNDYFYSEYPNLLWFAEMLSRTDSSEKALIIWSKVHPIAKATTGIEANQLTEILHAIIEDDDLFNVISDNSKIVTGQPNSRDDAVLRLTDENSVEKMHFLSEFHYELIRRYCTLYNIPFRTTSKSAQNLESELHNTDIFSKIINENRLKCRREACDEINKKFGFNLTVDYSDVIKMENKIIESNVENESTENISDKVSDDNNESDKQESDNSTT